MPPASGLALILAAATRVSAPPPPPEPIYGGTATEPGEFDAVVGIRLGGYQCTGTLLSPTLVLTAAHCLKDLDPQAPIEVFFGPRSVPGMDVAASGFSIHPSFTPPTSGSDRDIFDFGVVELSTPLVVDPFPEILWRQDEWDSTMVEGKDVILVGYGEADNAAPGEPSLGVKRKVTVPIDWLTDSGLEFFAGGDGKDSCVGDSGGPAFVRLPDGSLRLAGVLSRGSVPCGQGGLYGIPYAAACWIWETYGLALTDASCGDCSCLETAPPKEGCGCRAAWGHSLVPWWLLLGLPGVRRRPPP